MNAATGVMKTGTILDRILERTAADLAERKRHIPEAEQRARAEELPKPVLLRRALAGPVVGVIAEIKRASPSRGRFPVEVDPAAVAAEYLGGGAAALSVLTDEPFFQGSLADLALAAKVAHAWPTPAPVLRKDFVLDAYQIYEARATGADAFLLIVAALDDGTIRDLMGVGAELGMDALVEVHDEAELERASRLEAALIGVNNRDLRTFEVDLAVTERLAAMMPEGATVVGESGIFTIDDVRRLEAAGVDGVLVGESLIVAEDRSAAVRRLRGDKE